MPITVINVYDRPTYQTEKVKGWDVVRVFKGSSLVSNSNNTDMIFDATEGDYIIQQFLIANSNYKGTNLFELTKLENFDGFRIKANGLLNPNSFDSKSQLKIGFSILDETYSTALGVVEFNYGDKINFQPLDYWKDWYLDIEVTFFIDTDNSCYSFVVNGNFSFQRDINNTERLDVSLVPFCGNIPNITDNKVAIDLRSSETNFINPLYIKQVSIDFVE
jgi:hypothetical protein